MLLARGTPEDIERPDMVIQKKYDGSRIIVIKDKNSIRMHTRSWKNEISGFYPEVISELKKIPDGIYDAELAFFNSSGEDTLLTVLSPPDSDARIGLTPKLMIFDILVLEGRDIKVLPFEERQHLLVKILKDKGYTHIEKVITITKNKTEYFNKLGTRKAEGAVLKRLGSKYEENIRSKDWLKVKFSEDDDVVIIGCTIGKNARAATFGALMLGQYDSTGKIVYIGKTSGFTNDGLQVLIAKMKPLIISTPIVKDKIPDVQWWVKPKLVAKVKFFERTEDLKLRNPDFIELRTDKMPKDCILPEES